MGRSRTKNSVLTMITSVLRQVLTLVLTFVSRTVFIHILGAEYLGLNGLFSNILSLLALSELGIGSAISFYLYKPLAEHNTERIKTLMVFYKVCYRVIGCAMLGIGVCVMPVLPHIVNFDQGVPVNLYLVYFLYLLNSASTYLFFAYKQAIVTANQEQYKIEKINIVFTFINCVADIFVLLLMHDYIVYLVSKFVLVLVKNIIIAIKIDREYPLLKEKTSEKISKAEKRSFFSDIGSVALFNAGSALFNATDNIIISVLLGTIIVGYYSNYFLIITQIAMVIGLAVKSFMAGIGNVIAKENAQKQYSVFKELNFVLYFIASVCSICLFQLLNSFVTLWVGNVNASYVLSQTTVCFLCISFYFDSTTQILNSFRVASGNFHVGKSLQMIGGIVNIVFSIILGKQFGLEGIFAATILSKGAIAVTPFIVGTGKHVFKLKKSALAIVYYKEAAVTIAVASLIWFTLRGLHITDLTGFIFEALLTVVLAVVLLAAANWKSAGMKYVRTRIKKLLLR